MKTSKLCSMAYSTAAWLFLSSVIVRSADADAHRILASVLKNQEKLKSASYNIQRIDTFRSDEIWNHLGTGHIKTDKEDTLFGYAFKCKRIDLNSETIYERYNVVDIDHKNKTYRQFSNPSKGILGFPGGQMVFEELLHLDTSRLIAAYLHQDKSFYILTMNFRYAEDEQYNIKDRYKVLYIDKRTMLPVRMYRHMNSLGQKESQEIIITDLKINEGETNEFAFQVPADYNATDAARNTNAADILGKKLPAFISLSLDGKRISSHQLKGKVVLLDFWEVWCGPCIESMPKVQKIYEEYKQKGLLVLGVMSETKKNTVSAASRLIKLKGITFPSILNDHLKNHLKINAVPTYLLINKSGEIVDVQQGFSDELKTSIEKAL